MKNVSLKLPDVLNAKLERLAKDRATAKSDIIREALESYLAEGKNSQRLSIAELAADLIGCGEGPSDLATNPKYMRGFGK